MNSSRKCSKESMFQFSAKSDNIYYVFPPEQPKPLINPPILSGIGHLLINLLNLFINISINEKNIVNKIYW